MVMFSPLSRLRRQLSQRESQVPRVMHYTERCIEVRPRYLFDKFRFAGEFGSIVSYGRINYKNSHSSLHCCGCSLPYEHRPFPAGVLFVLWFRFLYKGIIIKHNKTEPTYTKTSLFLCEKRRFLWPGLRKEGNLFKLAGPGGLAFFHLTKKEVSKWPMKK